MLWLIGGALRSNKTGAQNCSITGTGREELLSGSRGWRIRRQGPNHHMHVNDHNDTGLYAKDIRRHVKGLGEEQWCAWRKGKSGQRVLCSALDIIQSHRKREDFFSQGIWTLKKDITIGNTYWELHAIHWVADIYWSRLWCLALF